VYLSDLSISGGNDGKIDEGQALKCGIKYSHAGIKKNIKVEVAVKIAYL
jgi:hypothetical protein